MKENHQSIFNPHFRKSSMLIDEIYFWTSTIKNWISLLKQEHFKLIVLSSLQYLEHRKLITVFAYVIMPNHIHLIWRMNKMNRTEFPSASFRKYTAHEFKKILRNENEKLLSRFKVEESTREYRFWLRDPLAIHVTNEDMLVRCLNYIHLNPLQKHWKLTNRPEDYKWSSAGYYVNGKDDFEITRHYNDLLWQMSTSTRM